MMVAGIDKKLSFVGAAIQKLKAETENEPPPYHMDKAEQAELAAYEAQNPESEQQFAEWVSGQHPFGIGNPWLNRSMHKTYRAFGLTTESTDEQWAEAYQTALDRFNRRNRHRRIFQ